MKKIILLLFGLFAGVFGQAQVSFVEETSTPFTGIVGGDAEFADVDNDGDLDILITGLGEAKLFKNDGAGFFSEYNPDQFIGVNASTIAFADVDNDQDMDVAINGLENSNTTIRLYLNDGQGNFSENTAINFTNVAYGNIGFADIDNDGDQDFLSTGQLSPLKATSLYLNDGTGNFTETAAPSLEDVDGAFAFEDVDNDGDQDLMLSGIKSLTSIVISRLYMNNGTGNFTEVPGTSFISVRNASLDFADIDNDNDPDLLISGRLPNTDAGTELYLNDGLGNFTIVSQTTFTDALGGSNAFANVDNDGDQDLVITGANNVSNYNSILYVNDGTGNFSASGVNLVQLTGSDVNFADIDDDNDPDLLVMGDSPSAVVTTLYRNQTTMDNEDFWKPENNFMVYPNPTQGKITFSASMDISLKKVLVFDTHGRKIKEVIPNKTQNQIDLSKLPSGIYFLQLFSEKGQSVQKIIKE